MICEGCDGSGIRNATPDCPIDCPVGWTVIERCDACEMFDSDIAAAFERDNKAKIVECANKGEHVIVRK